MEKSEYLTREECIEQLLNECNILQIEGNYYPSKASASLYVPLKNLQKSINYYTKDIDSPVNNGERWYRLLHNINKTPLCFCGKKRKFQKTSLGYTLGCCTRHSDKIIRGIEDQYFNNFKPDFSVILSKNSLKKLYKNHRKQKQFSLFTRSKLFKNKIILNSLLYHTQYLIPINYSNIDDKKILKERLFIILNNVKELPQCKTKDCSNFCNFSSLESGYYTFCSVTCVNKDKEIRYKISETVYFKYGDCHFRDIALLQNNRSEQEKRNTVLKRERYCIIKYGYRNPFQVPKIKEKIAETNFNNTGYYHNSHNPYTIERRKNTSFLRTGYYHHSHNPLSNNYKIGNHAKLHDEYNNIYYHSGNEKWFLDLIDDFNLNKYIEHGPSIKYKNIKERFYIVDYILNLPHNRYLVEIKANHIYFYKELFNGTLFAKWECAEQYCRDNNYRGYVFIMNNDVMTKKDIINNYMIPFFIENYPFI